MEIGYPSSLRRNLPRGAGEGAAGLSLRRTTLLGSLAHIAEAYGALTEAIKEAGLSETGEGREWHYHFEGDTSPGNVLGLHMGIL